MNIDEITLGDAKKLTQLMAYSPQNGELKHGKNICILQRGWVMVGDLSQKGHDMTLKNASVIRIWGTSRGIGEIAGNGPTDKTKLDTTSGDVFFHELTLVARIKCNEEKWK